MKVKFIIEDGKPDINGNVIKLDSFTFPKLK